MPHDMFDRQHLMEATAGMRITDEERKARIVAFIRERQGLEAQLEQATEKKAKDEITASIGRVNENLRAYGHTASAPQRAAETREAAAGAESR